MQLTSNEIRLINKLYPKSDYTNFVVTRKSDKEFDLSVEGFDFFSWVPLAAIRRLLNWTSYAVANLTDYPEMALDGDWSAVRDSSEDRIWGIFNLHVLDRL